MTHTTTILADHKGYTAPRVSGDEYFVDAVIDITSYTVTGEVVTAASLGLDTITSAMITGEEVAANGFSIIAGTDGSYTSNSSLTILGYVRATGVELTATDVGVVRIRVYGNL